MRFAAHEIATFNWTLEQDVEMFSRWGMTAMAVVIRKLEACGAAKGVRLMRDAGIAASSISVAEFAPEETSQWPARRDALRRGLDLAAQVGAKRFIVLTGPAPKQSYEESAARFVEQVREIAPEAGKLGVCLALEPHSSVAVDAAFVYRLHDALDLADEIGSPWFAVNMEVAHCFQERGLYENIQKRVGRIVNVQCGDFKIGTRQSTDRVPLGDGCIPLERIFDALERAGYEGYCEIETIGPRIEAMGYEESMRRSLAYLAERRGWRPEGAGRR